MRAEELRIGNFVYDRSNKILKIDRFYGDKIECNVKDVPKKDKETGINLYYHPYTEEITFCNPIPLTEEWLEKLGFELDKNTDLYNKGGHDVEMLDRGVEAYVREYGEWYCYVEYVHSLQNLYFALTGEEL